MPPYKQAKKSAWSMGKYEATDEDWEAMRWCINNGITIAPFAKEPGDMGEDL